ncbi:hypothetical protein [Lacticaseibacillus hulanensis]|uniref:hypothetical protein n=1 Tax=Lacticaseibacillus hulanensis TaxID=2493111 RepID=UPI000FDA6A4E|nr:hypothetical protein [Lacticaseibacillus hulanensis]
MKKLIPLFTFILGLAIGAALILARNSWQNQASSTSYQIVQGPTRATTVKYEMRSATYAFPNKDKQLCVIIKHHGDYALYVLESN